MARCSHDMPCAASPVVTVAQNGELFNAPAPVTSRACVPYVRAMAGNLASTPAPNSIRGRRDREKLETCTSRLSVDVKLNGNGFINASSLHNKCACFSAVSRDQSF